MDGYVVLYHAVGAGWQPGDPLLPRDAQAHPEPWKWESLNFGEPHDTDCVSFADLDEATQIAAEFNLRVLAVRLHIDDIRLNDERYPAVYGVVPADAIIEVL
jgi:hypothetical protein